MIVKSEIEDEMEEEEEKKKKDDDSEELRNGNTKSPTEKHQVITFCLTIRLPASVICTAPQVSTTSMKASQYSLNITSRLLQLYTMSYPRKRPGQFTYP